jgi:hypothetical protein
MVSRLGSSLLGSRSDIMCGDSNLKYFMGDQMIKSGAIKLSLVATMCAAFTAMGSIDSTVVLKAPAQVDDFKTPYSSGLSNDLDQKSSVLLAQSGKKKKRSSKGRKKIISSEKRFKSNKKSGSTNLDFDEAAIGGERKNPLGSLINTAKSKKGFDFIEIRKEWHNNMIQSSTKLD